MKLLEQLHHWRNILLCQAHEPTFIPLTRNEFSILSADRAPYTRTERFIADALTKVFGIDVFESPFAPEMRARQVEIPVTQIAETAAVASENFKPEYVHRFLSRKLTAYICHDTTNIKLTFEYDCWAKFKRKLRITKWFPVRTRTVTIEGRVLYPYLKVSLPHNKHHVQFKHTQ